MQLGYIIMVVPDVDATMTFYERAFGLTRRFIDETKKYGELQTGQTRLAFAADDLARGMIPVELGRAGPKMAAPPMEVAFTTENVEGAHKQALAAGAVEVKSPEKKPWGQLVSHVRDNNGFLVEICSPLP